MAGETRVVVTTAKGEVARAIMRPLAALGYEVVVAARGDDLGAVIRDAAAVVILEGTVRGGVDYHVALEAVAEAVEQSRVRKLVSVTIAPEHVPEHARALEAVLDQGHRPLVGIRAGLVVGSPTTPGPIDAALFANPKPALVRPGDGKQRVRPIVVDDVAALVSAALAAPAPVPPLRAEGPDEMSVDDLLKQLNPGVGVARERIGLRRAVLGLWILSIVLFAAVALGAPIGALVPGLSAVAAMAATVIVTPGSTSLLPAKNLLIEPTETDALATVKPQHICDVWTPAALKTREWKSELRRSARKRRRIPGSALIAMFLLANGTAALVAGLHDLVTVVSGLGSRMAGLTLAAAG